MNDVAQYCPPQKILWILILFFVCFSIPGQTATHQVSGAHLYWNPEKTVWEGSRLGYISVVIRAFIWDMCSNFVKQRVEVGPFRKSREGSREPRLLFLTNMFFFRINLSYFYWKKCAFSSIMKCLTDFKIKSSCRCVQLFIEALQLLTYIPASLLVDPDYPELAAQNVFRKSHRTDEKTAVMQQKSAKAYETASKWCEIWFGFRIYKESRRHIMRWTKWLSAHQSHLMPQTGFVIFFIT